MEVQKAGATLFRTLGAKVDALFSQDVQAQGNAVVADADRASGRDHLPHLPLLPVAAITIIGVADWGRYVCPVKLAAVA